MKEIEINESAGTEICLKKGDFSLIVKVGENSFIPDFATTVTTELSRNPAQCIYALEKVWHRNPRGPQELAETIAWFRDQAFASVKADEAPKAETVETEAKAETATKKAKKTA